MKKESARNVIAFMLLLLLAACTTQPAATPEEPTATPEVAAESDEFVFGMILVGPQDDHGWSEAHFNAGRYVEAHIDGSEMLVIDNLNPDTRPETTVEQAVDDMVEQGAKLIFITSDDFSADTTLVAEKYPDTIFVHTSGDHVLRGIAPPNLGNYMPRMIYGKMMAGCTAALATESGQIAYVGPLINNETRRLVNASYLGARYCYEQFRERDPDELAFSVEWLGFWFHIPGVTQDPVEVTNDFIDQGVDVVISGIDTTEALTVAAERAEGGEEVWAIPYDFEGACDEAPSVCLGVPYFNWGPGYLRLAQEVIEGNWEPRWEWVEPDWDDLNNADTSPIGYEKGPALTAEQAAQLDEFIAGLADGSIVLFEGPLQFQDGSVFLEKGVAATDEEIWYMPQLLEGMEGVGE